MMSASPLVRQVLNTVTRYDLVQPGDALVVHCRGDAAGTALVHALADLNADFGFDLDLTLVHIERPLSREPTDGEAARAWVERLAEERGLPMRGERLDVAAGAASSSGEPVIEVLVRAAGEVGAAAVAVPTCADDRAEAVLAAVLRGGSPSDLAGPPVSEPLSAEPAVSLIRPLWTVRRSDIERDLQSRDTDPAGLPEPPAPDDLVRRVRDELLVHLQSRYNPRIREALLRFADSVTTGREAGRHLAGRDRSAGKH